MVRDKSCLNGNVCSTLDKNRNSFTQNKCANLDMQSITWSLLSAEIYLI